MRRAILPLVVVLACCSTPVPVHWDVHKEPAPKVTIPDPDFDGGDPVAGRVAFADVGCTECHRVAGEPDLPGQTATGPLLQGLRRYPPNVVAGRITSVNAGGAEAHDDRTMKKSAQTLTTRQLIDIVAYLRSRG